MEKDETKICSLENLHGEKLKMDLHPDMIIPESIETKTIIKQNGDGDDD
jgi:hypothetical protein